MILFRSAFIGLHRPTSAYIGLYRPHRLIPAYIVLYRPTSTYIDPITINRQRALLCYDHFVLSFHCVNMPYKFRRMCPICYRQDLLYLADHLRQVHKLSSEERQPLLKAALFSHQLPPSFSPRVHPQGLYTHPILQGLPQYPMSMNPQLQQPSGHQGTKQQPRKVAKIEARPCLQMTPYPDFKFNHMFSMLVVGPTQCGKTYFVEQLLTKNCIKYPSKKSTRIYWFYNQWQRCYATLQRTLGDEIEFAQGLPDLSEDLREINPKFHNVLVFDDLMSKATDSPVLSTLFTQGRHRNASVILLLQNMFPKGKFNTDISRNAQYMVLFRSPSDRKQMDIIAERIFAKDKSNFMSAYVNATEKPYGYLLIDNQPKTPSDKQVVAEVFENCHSYPKITTGTKPAKNFEQQLDATIQNPSESRLTSKPLRKRKVEMQRQRKRTTKTRKKPPAQPHFKEIPDFDEEPIHLTQHQLNAMARRGSSFGPKMYE